MVTTNVLTKNRTAGKITHSSRMYSAYAREFNPTEAVSNNNTPQNTRLLSRQRTFFRPSSPSSHCQFVRLDLDSLAMTSCCLDVILPRRWRQPCLVVRTDEEELGAVTENQRRTSIPPDAGSTSSHPVGCETLIEGASPIVAE
jgi:hypothetical protein